MVEKTGNPLTTHQILTIVALMLPSFLDSAMYSVVETFFPPEAKQKGVNTVTTSYVFAVYGLIKCVASPVLGKYISKISAKNMYLAGISTSAIALQCFGALVRLPSTKVFIVLSFITRSVESLGSAARATALWTICAHTFPDRVASIVGLTEMMMGIGFAVGPAIGGLLYQVGDYEFPFLILGCSVVVSAVISLFILPKQVEIQQESGSIFELLSQWFLWPMMLIIAIDSTGFAFIQPALAVHIQQFYISPLQLGLFYFASTVIYLIFAPLAGYFVDKTGLSRAVVLFGVTCSGIGYLLLGPSQVLHLPSKLVIIFLGKLVLEFGWSFSFTAPYQDLLLSIERHGLSSTIQRQGVIAGLFNSINSIGSVVGPSLSGVVVSTLGFPRGCSLLSLIAFIAVIAVGLFSVFELSYIERNHIQCKDYQLLETNDDDQDDG